MRKALVVLGLSWLLGAGLAAAASAAGLSPPVADCYAHQRLTGAYTAAQLKNGLATMPADVKEYSNCYGILEQALLSKLGKLKDGGSAGGGGSFLPVWLIAVLAALVVAGVGLGAMAWRNQGERSDPAGSP
jgi:hypothetical protein